MKFAGSDFTRCVSVVLGAVAVAPDEIVTVECDVLSPNALGSVLTEQNIARLHARVIAGGANNQLARDDFGTLLRDREILFAPDFVINGGGIIRVAAQIEGWSDAEVERRVLAIADTLKAIFERAAQSGEPTNAVANQMAVERIARGKTAKAKAAE